MTVEPHLLKAPRYGWVSTIAFVACILAGLHNCGLCSELGQLFPICVQDKWGFIDQRGKVVISPAYSKVASDFGSGQFSYAHPTRLDTPKNGAKATDAGIRYFVCGSDGLSVVEGRTAHSVNGVSRDVSVVLGLGDGLVRLVRPDMSMSIFDLQQRFRGECDSDTFFGSMVDGLLPVKQNNRWGYVDRVGHVVIKPTYDAADNFHEGFAGVKVERKWGFIDQNGKMVIHPLYDIVGTFQGGVASVWVTGKRPAETRCSFINRRGKMAFPQKFLAATDFREGVARARDVGSGLWGYIDRSGKYVIAPSFTNEQDFGEGFAAVDYGSGVGNGATEKLSGYIDTSGRLVLPIRGALELLPFSSGLAWVKASNGSGYIDTNGRWIWESKEDGAK